MRLSNWSAVERGRRYAFPIVWAAILATALMLLMEGQFERGRTVPAAGWHKVAMGLYLAVTVLVGLAAFVQCGPGECPDNPTSYWLLERAAR